jgi:hypothetical protein
MVALIVAVPVATWWAVGDLSTDLPDPDYQIRPFDIGHTTEQVAGVSAAVLAAAAVVALIHAGRAGRFDRRWWPVLVELMLAGALCGAGWRVLTAGVIGANIGAGWCCGSALRSWRPSWDWPCSTGCPSVPSANIPAQSDELNRPVQGDASSPAVPSTCTSPTVKRPSTRPGSRSCGESGSPANGPSTS